MNQLNYEHEPRLDTILMVEKAKKTAANTQQKRTTQKPAQKNTVPNIRANTHLHRKLKQDCNIQQANHLGVSGQSETEKSFRNKR